MELSECQPEFVGTKKVSITEAQGKAKGKAKSIGTLAATNLRVQQGTMPQLAGCYYIDKCFRLTNADQNRAWDDGGPKKSLQTRLDVLTSVTNVGAELLTRNGNLEGSVIKGALNIAVAIKELISLDDREGDDLLLAGLLDSLLGHIVLAEGLKVASKSREIPVIDDLTSTIFISALLSSFSHNDPIDLQLELDSSSLGQTSNILLASLLIISDVLTSSNREGRVTRASLGQIVTSVTDVGAEAILGDVDLENSSLVGSPDIAVSVGRFLILLLLKDDSDSVTLLESLNERLLLDGVLTEGLNVGGKSREVPTDTEGTVRGRQNQNERRDYCAERQFSKSI